MAPTVLLAVLVVFGLIARGVAAPGGAYDGMTLGLGRLAAGPSVEDDNPLPQGPQSAKEGHGQHAGGGGGQPQQRRCAAMPARVLRQVLGPAFNPSYMAFSLEEPRSAKVQGGAMPNMEFGVFQSAMMPGSGQPGRVAKESPWSGPGAGAGNALDPSPFSVDEDFSEVLADVPAWKVQYEFDMPVVTLSRESTSGTASGTQPHHVNYRTAAGRNLVMEGVAAPATDGGDTAGDDLDADMDSLGLARSGRAVMPFGRNLQWHCESPLRWMDLGPDYFPRYLRTADCSHHSCTNEHFVCKPRSFTIKVLRRREGMCTPGPASEDLGGAIHEESSAGLPQDLRDMWIWELRAVNFCCVCRPRM